MTRLPTITPFSLDRRRFAIGSAMLGVAALTAARMPQATAPALAQERFEALVPRTVGNWRFETSSGLVLPPPDALSDRLYDNLVTRTYRGPGDAEIMLLLAYNPRQDGVLQIHRPEFCYEAAGYSLSPSIFETVPMGLGGALPFQAFVARGQARDEVVAFWTRVGDAFPRTWGEQRITVARRNLAGVIPDGMLARVSIVGNAIDRSLPVLKSFIIELDRRSKPEMRNLLFGPDAAAGGRRSG